MPACSNHPQIEASAPCGHCGRSFCDGCLVDLIGQRLCEACKGRLVSGITTRPQQHPLALPALLVPTLGYLACGLPVLVTSPIGLLLGMRVLRELRDRPHYTGRTLALAGMVISGGTLAAFVIAMIGTLTMIRSWR